MSIYMIAEILEVTDEESYGEYVRRVPEIIKQYGGRYLARSNEILPISGDWKPDRLIILEFPDAESLRACFGSPQYRAVAPLRERATRSRSLAVPGLA